MKPEIKEELLTEFTNYSNTAKASIGKLSTFKTTKNHHELDKHGKKELDKLMYYLHKVEEKSSQILTHISNNY